MSDSIESVPAEFLESLRAAGIENLLEFLSKKSESELRLNINQQRGEPELNTEDKLELLRTKLSRNPGSFLSQFGKHLNPLHLESFKSIRKENFEIDACLKQMEVSVEGRNMQIKNRRYEALQRLVDTSDYFTEEEMQRRNPILYNQLIGRYHTKEEREAFLFQSSQSSSSAKSGPSSNRTPLTDMLIAHMNRQEGVCSDRRIDQEMQIQKEKQAEKEYSLKKHDSINSWNDDDYKDKSSGDEDDEQDEEMQDTHEEEIDEAEKDLLKEEFFTTMYCHFLEGKDEEFLYETVDDNPEYDVGEVFDQDEEEKYFDSEEPEEVLRKEQNLMSTDQEEAVDSQALRMDIKNLHHTDNPVTEIDEEDELDSYMREIEEEVKRQNQFSFSVTS